MNGIKHVCKSVYVSEMAVFFRKIHLNAEKRTKRRRHNVLQDDYNLLDFFFFVFVLIKNGGSLNEGQNNMYFNAIPRFEFWTDIMRILFRSFTNCVDFK